MEEALNAARREQMGTPLLGEENPELFETDDRGVMPERFRPVDASATPGLVSTATTLQRGRLREYYIIFGFY